MFITCLWFTSISELATAVLLQIDKENTVWTTRSDTCRKEDLKSRDRTMYLLNDLNANTFYKVEVRAHNEIGFSVPSELVFKTAAGELTSFSFKNRDNNILIHLRIRTIMS